MQRTFYYGNGNCFRYVDQHGRPVRRTRDEYPYSYDAYVTWEAGISAKQVNGSVYSDRLYQFDSKKYDELCEKHFENQGQSFYGREPEKIEAFLRDYNNDQSIKLLFIMEGVNASNGYPYWVFLYKYKK